MSPTNETELRAMVEQIQTLLVDLSARVDYLVTLVRQASVADETETQVALGLLNAVQSADRELDLRRMTDGSDMS